MEGCKKGAGSDRDEVWGAEGSRRGQQKGASGRVLDSRNTERRGVGHVRRWAGNGVSGNGLGGWPAAMAFGKGSLETF